jgi:hypothetical protein
MCTSAFWQGMYMLSSVCVIDLVDDVISIFFPVTAATSLSSRVCARTVVRGFKQARSVDSQMRMMRIATRALYLCPCAYV